MHENHLSRTRFAHGDKTEKADPITGARVDQGKGLLDSIFHFGFQFHPAGYTCIGRILRCRFGIPGAFPGAAERLLGIVISVWMRFPAPGVPEKALSTA